MTRLLSSLPEFLDFSRFLGLDIFGPFQWSTKSLVLFCGHVLPILVVGKTFGSNLKDHLLHRSARGLRADLFFVFLCQGL